MEDKGKISYHPISDIDRILHIAKEIATGKMKKENAPWLKNMYFAGRTLCIDMWTNGKEDVMTFCHSDESVGFFSGGMRHLLSIPSCRILEELMILSDIKHNKKWIE